MKNLELTKKEVELLQRALKESQLYSINKAFENKDPQAANNYVTNLQKIFVRLKEV